MAAAGWIVLAALALLWPDHVASAVDGIPLDRALEAILVGGIFPALCVLHRGFLRTRFARVCILLLLGWKAAGAALFVQDGWCLRFEPALQVVKDARGAPHAWDLRADWRADDPVCSAIVARPYVDIAAFPAWFFNLPPPSESWPQPEERPPGATTALRVSGFASTARDGVLRVDVGPDVHADTSIDGRIVRGDTPIAAGVHRVAIEGVLTGDRWALAPLWNGRDLWSSPVVATVRRPSPFAVRVHPAASLIAPLVAAALLGAWTASAVAQVTSVAVLAWTIGASIAVAWLLTHDLHGAARWTIAALAAGAAVPVPGRYRNMRGALLMIGVPWIVFVLVISAPAIGRWFLYGVGHDMWMYQRFAYRIVLQGYWLEGGTPTFWFQPLYRWINGLLHVVFGDSSVGEWWWDGACLLAGAMLSFRITRRAGFRWAIAAAAATLGVFVLGTAWNLIGVGLSDISAAGFLSLASLAAIASRRRPAYAVAAGVLATLAFYTRLNHLLLAFAVAVFALPLRVPVAALPRPRTWRTRVAWRAAAIVVSIVAVGILLFAWRTWHYTGVFSVFYGTQRSLLSNWRPGAPIAASVGRTIESVLMVLTVNDPPRFDVFALPVLAGAGAALLAIFGVPVFKELPAAGVLYFLASIAGAIVARGSAYPGRFSVHVMPITCALMMCAAAGIVRRAAAIKNSESRTKNASTAS
jgi:hypothetical protein